MVKLAQGDDLFIPVYTDQMFIDALTYEPQTTGQIMKKIKSPRGKICSRATAITFLEKLAANPNNKILKTKVGVKPYFLWQRIR